MHSFEKLETKWRYVADIDGEVAGFLFGREIEGRRAGVETSLLSVHPRSQRMGVGSKLISSIEKDGRRAGHKTAYTGTPFALDFYKKQGYTIWSTSFALAKELIGREIPPPSDRNVRHGDFADLDVVIRDFSPRDRAGFLTSFFDAYRTDSSRIFLAFSDEKGKGQKCIGGGIGRINSRDRDLVEVCFLCGDRNTRLSLLRRIEYQASKEGTRWVGVKTRDKSFAAFLETNDYEIAHMPDWWTLDYLKKEL